MKGEREEIREREKESEEKESEKEIEIEKGEKNKRVFDIWKINYM